MSEEQMKEIFDLEKFAGWEPPDSDRAKAMIAGANAIRVLSDGLDKHKERIVALEKALLDVQMPTDSQEASVYAIHINEEAKKTRLSVFFGPGQTKLLAFLDMSTPETYDLAHMLLKKYDKLEGIE